MITSQKENTSVLTQENTTLTEFVVKLNTIYSDIEANNIIVNIFSLKNVVASDLDEFLQVSNKHRKAKHSFIIVSASVNIDEIDNKLQVVPTLQEAHDIIEMEEIERDLGI